ncbi:carboxymuconolactone decarboxylase family protein [Adhaeribacter swui]|uniref:Carboxymuconolactone decarboxylase family protein n=1 Tax=Adhaeribacter swui TaxID=2086471 RepID=A0A7G7GDZ9_9BACT|nr:carboxymuconolactone decarboxylase family protein [Adhaeribacter swui]QNF35383.1 carboxymuconolactone decarboxylase family protein [Adhaeribacter swui]
MNTRVNINEAEPQALKAMYGLEHYVRSSGLSKTHQELIKVRASQINGCAYCLNMHTKDALKQGETPQRLFLLNAWKEAGLFTEEEKIILALTEEVTLIYQGGVQPATYQKAEQLLGKNYLAQVVMAIITINAWNRIAITSELPLE